MSKPILCTSFMTPRLRPAAPQRLCRSPTGVLPSAELRGVPGLQPVSHGLDPPGAGIAPGNRNPLHDVVDPMSHHVLMLTTARCQRMDRRSEIVCDWTFLPGVVIIMPEDQASEGYSEPLMSFSSIFLTQR